MREILEKINDTVFGEDDFRLNQMLSVETRKNDELWLHIDDVEEKSIGEKLQLLRDGFKSLAHALISEKKFESIETISGTSWIATKNPGLLEKLGFTIDNNAPGFEESKKEYYSKSRLHNPKFKGIEPSYSYMSKSKFIELYGK